MNFEISPTGTEVRLTWDDAVLYCFSLGDRWRLPTKDELKSIYESENDFNLDWYWSSSTHEIFNDRKSIKSFYNGFNYHTAITDTLLVRAVRSL